MALQETSPLRRVSWEQDEGSSSSRILYLTVTHSHRSQFSEPKRVAGASTTGEQERDSAFTRQWNGSENKIGVMETSASMESRTREPHNGRQLQWEAST